MIKPLRHLVNHIGDVKAINMVLENEEDGYETVKHAVINEFEKNGRFFLRSF